MLTVVFPATVYFPTLIRMLFLVPTAQILGGPDLHVDKGSTINLTCSIKYSPEPPAYIFWYHHDDVSTRSGIKINTLKTPCPTFFSINPCIF